MKLTTIAGMIFPILLISCATTMTPSQFLLRLPKSTRTNYYDRLKANEAISNGKCKLLVQGRKYTAPIGFTVYNDLNNGAKGVDEWVLADGGNSYILNNFEWISAGKEGSTQLIIYFDTMACR